MTSTELDTIDAECEQLVLEAIDFATSSPTPDPSTAFVDIYANPLTKGG
jgi:TPP-dependent pyruvate/acetoin dehydrogenase alpha subunit